MRLSQLPRVILGLLLCTSLSRSVLSHSVEHTLHRRTRFKFPPSSAIPYYRKGSQCKKVTILRKIWRLETQQTPSVGRGHLQSNDSRFKVVRNVRMGNCVGGQGAALSIIAATRGRDAATGRHKTTNHLEAPEYQEKTRIDHGKVKAGLEHVRDSAVIA